ncbi:hypothetical protein K466DRAFT_601204 [Polyporus arcularius HHB13444]|uniref:Uncharacterized protein n=1 Tax=Polyporus arcularius HHB13444 TaxID=1314778 RepID=A0A5C3P7D9_9APHY|nr:hypothetical protein K466DRAFT_601204 [Polyporus arcularius HHB13444]
MSDLTKPASRIAVALGRKGEHAFIYRRTYVKIAEPVPPRKGDAYDMCSPGPCVSAIFMKISPESEEDFNQWCDEQHVALFSKVP